MHVSTAVHETALRALESFGLEIGTDCKNQRWPSQMFANNVNTPSLE
jgi:hypothetical protein